MLVIQTKYLKGIYCVKKKRERKLSHNFVHITIGVIGAANLCAFFLEETRKIFLGKWLGVYNKH